MLPPTLSRPGVLGSGVVGSGVVGSGVVGSGVDELAWPVSLAAVVVGRLPLASSSLPSNAVNAIALATTTTDAPATMPTTNPVRFFRLGDGWYPGLPGQPAPGGGAGAAHACGACI
ncbi:MAG: hypothetical protein LBE08_00015 [Bifidobacteriaceae bacterium]|nr:hypothetical protein [Bifidobacteriaceae bacterium]